MTSIVWITIGFTIFAAIMPLILKMVFPHKITPQEIGISIAASVVITLLIFGLTYLSIPTNTEIRHGQVTSKERERVSCSHRYPCGRICSGSGENRVCRTKWCKRHSYDLDWAVYNTVDRRIEISRVDSRGMQEPPRWTEVIIGEPYSREFSYQDYLQVNENSLFNQGKVEGEYDILNYPSVYDYYRTRLALKTHSTIDIDTEAWNNSIRERLETWGAHYQINLIFVFTEYDRNYFEWLRYQWNGGRKNDTVVLIGTDSEGTSLEWAEVFSWSKNEYFNTKTRSDLLALDTLDKDQILGIIDDNVSNFERRPMEDFKYLLKERKYSPWLIGLMVLLQLGVNIGVWLVIVNNSETTQGRRFGRYHRRF